MLAIGTSKRNFAQEAHIWKFGLKSIDFRYNNYQRNTGLSANYTGLGFKFVTAENGQIAIDILTSNEHRFDIILMDLMMPILDGYETSIQIRAFKNESIKNIPIIALTADVTQSVKEKFKIPVFAYQVSGEYSLISNAIQKKIINKDAVYESLVAFKRAGANAIVSYYADRIDKIIK